MIDMPPRRTMPPQLRDKLLLELREKMDRPPRRSRVPYAVAAGVAALAAGGVVVTTTVHGTTQPAGKVTGLVKGVEEPAQRCVDASAKVDGFPSGADWRVVVHTSLSGFTDLAFKVNGKPVFCEVTLTGVTLSKYDVEPNYVPGTKTGVVTETPGHQFGIVLDASWRGVDAYMGDRMSKQAITDTGLNSPYATEEDMVIWSDREDGMAGYIAPHGGKNPAKLPAAPTGGGVTVVDRPYTGPVDRTSEQGKFLARCIQANAGTESLPDADSWQPGAWLAGTEDTFLAIRGVDSVTFCTGGRTGHGNIPFFGLGASPDAVVLLPAGAQPVVARQVRDYVVDGPTLGEVNAHGVLFGSVSTDAASMTMTTDTKGTLTAVVRGGTFVADYGYLDDMVHPDPVVTSVTVKDAQGKVIYQGKPAK